MSAPTSEAAHQGVPHAKALLQAKQVGVDIAGRQLLRDVSLDLLRGELVVVAGPNGAGKSTLLRVLAGDIAPSSGSVTIQARPVTKVPARELGRLRAVLPQTSRVEFSFPVRDVVAMGRAPWRGRPEQDRDDEIIDGALAAVDAVALAHRDVTTLSGGEIARVTLARVLAQDTPVLLLDEPTAALDIAHQELVLRQARALADRGVAVLAVLHDLNAAARFADRIVMLHQGAVHSAGPPITILQSSPLSAIYGCEIDVHHLPSRQAPVVLPADRDHDHAATRSFDHQGGTNGIPTARAE